MPSLKPIPDLMIRDIDRLLEMHRGQCISLYAEAEKLRQKWVARNIALEDVVSVLVERCGSHAVAVAIDSHAGVDVLFNEDELTEARQSG
ncbi:MAG: hypothetical protein U1E16_02425 [Hyphomicrobiales bacterium]|uniref:hypothetical protein n=1 Tax=Aestuariivirga sp. TaxID=2650926 RepID=UPI0035B35766